MTFLLISTVFLVGLVSAQTSITLEELRRVSKKTAPGNEKMETKKAVNGEIPKETGKNVATGNNQTEFLAEGSYSKMDKPFIFVARDSETLKMIGSMIGEFEPVGEIDFKTYAVVAAFSGEKETGGYSVSIKMTDGKCVIQDVAPVHGAIVTEALTKPFAVVKVKLEEEASMSVSAGETWTSGMERYEVVEGTFEYSGGFLGISRKFDLDGEIYAMRHGDLFSLVLSISEKSGVTNRRLFETVSGTLNEEKPSIRRVEAAELYDRPHPPLVVTVKFEGGQLLLEMKPGKRDYVVSDGFEGKGTVTAELRPAG
jgi:hypothetical protein